MQRTLGLDLRASFTKENTNRITKEKELYKTKPEEILPKAHLTS